MPGVDVSGLIFDAGPVNSPVLLQVGTGHAGKSDRNDPTALQDVFFRIGGATAGKATVSLEVNSDNTILDNIWAWRADHGNGVGWTSTPPTPASSSTATTSRPTACSSSTTRRPR